MKDIQFNQMVERENTVVERLMRIGLTRSNYNVFKEKFIEKIDGEYDEQDIQDSYVDYKQQSNEDVDLFFADWFQDYTKDEHLIYLKDLTKLKP